MINRQSRARQKVHSWWVSREVHEVSDRVALQACVRWSNNEAGHEQEEGHALAENTKSTEHLSKLCIFYR